MLWLMLLIAQKPATILRLSLRRRKGRHVNVIDAACLDQRGNRVLGVEGVEPVTEREKRNEARDRRGPSDCSATRVERRGLRLLAFEIQGSRERAPRRNCR